MKITKHKKELNPTARTADEDVHAREELITDHHRAFELKGATNKMKTADNSGPNGLFLIRGVEVKTPIERVDSFCAGGINGETGGSGFLPFNGFVRTGHQRRRVIRDFLIRYRSLGRWTLIHFETVFISN